ncbi:ribosome maturation factor RimP [Anaerosacchariphilus sp. NSJ-68]|uniref:Ribosome maturation factor RimP n=2 Tax=Lachnospiraceae TaxID=186803 RepID=A0A923LCQ7_9FIRM|nr:MULTISPECIES: ribosome maturation factor RimP [Lachnospiraceae]MBC5659765.1 ribosome maturation factor RimP [Anaerosacchariphilus hominis]MBC5697431.1 ribosome maturation factor RimP [Roseburia difficilis]
MTKREEYEQKTEQLLAPIMEANGFEMVDVEYVKEAGTWYLRAYIDKPGGITVDDCEIVNRALGALLDRDDFIEESYILEVSSPGLGRPLKKERDFVRSQGEEVEIRTYRMVERQKEFRGVLKTWDKETVTIETEEGQEQVFDRDNIALIRLAFDF